MNDAQSMMHHELGTSGEEQQPPMHFLVLGRNSMLRDAIVQQALRQGNRVSVVVASEKETQLSEHEKLTLMVADDFTTVDKPQIPMEAYDCLIDTTTPEMIANEPNVEKYTDILYTYKTRLIHWVRESKVKKSIFVDQAALFAVGEPVAMARETQAINPVGFGRAYSVIWDAYCQQCHEVGNVIRVHPAEIYGPGGWLQHKIVDPLKYTGHIRIIGEGDNHISPLHVEDAARGILLAARKGSVHEDYCLGGPEVVFRDFLEMTTGLMGLELQLKKAALWWEKTRRGIMAAEHKAFSYQVDTGKARQDLGWEPQYDNLQQGIAHVLKELGVLAWK